MKIRKFLKNPWVIGICTAIFGALVSLLFDRINGKVVFSTLWGILSGAWNIILSVLNFRLKVWWIIVGLIVIFAVLCLIAKYNEKKNEYNERSAPSFLDYTKDRLQGWHWEWNWRKNYYGKYEIEGLHPVCEDCGSPLVDGANYYCYECVRCRKQYTESIPDYNNIKIYILDNVKRDLYPREIKQ